jgi:hypothetical protein
MGGREVMTLQTYLIHFRDRRLALAVGAGLEDRLARDGHDAVALVPVGGGLGLTRADGAGCGPSRLSYSGTPQVVALYEEGLLARLESLGLTAYIGIGPGEEPGAIRWSNRGGALLLPVTTARDLVDAIAAHTPWTPHAARLAKRTLAWRHDTGLPGTPPSALSRKIAVAGIAGPLLLTGLPGAAAAAATHASASTDAQPSAPAAPVSATFTADQAVQQQPAQAPAPASSPSFFDRIGSAVQYYMQQTGQAALDQSRADQATGAAMSNLAGQAAAALPDAWNGMVSGAGSGLETGLGIGVPVGAVAGGTLGSFTIPGIGTGTGVLGGGYLGGEVGLIFGGGIGGTVGAVNGFINSPAWKSQPTTTPPGPQSNLQGTQGGDVNGVSNAAASSLDAQASADAQGAAGTQGAIGAQGADGTQGAGTSGAGTTAGTGTGSDAGAASAGGTGSGGGTAAGGGTGSSGGGTGSGGGTAAGGGTGSSGGGSTGSGGGTASSGGGSTGSGGGTASSGGGMTSTGSTS